VRHTSIERFLVLIAATCCVCNCFADDTVPAPLQVIRAGAVNDTVVDALTPGGLVQTRSGDLITSFVNKGDSAAGSKCYLVRSNDAGKTWAEPYLVIEAEDANEGVFVEIVQLPSGDLMLMIIRISHSDSSRKGVFGYRESKVELQTSRDNGETFQSIGFLSTPPGSLTSTIGALYQLNNGDLIIPAYCYASLPRQHPGYEYGSGFYRSIDGGKHWGPLETVFKDPPSVNETAQNFNESAFAVREDGLIIAYARVDVHQGDDYKQNNMWMCESRDNGLTWSPPVETDIVGIYPAIKRLSSKQFVMICGLRDSEVERRTTSVFTSDNGINWSYRGHPYYSRTNGIPANSATGGSQAMVTVGDDSIYLVFYAHDPTLPGYHQTYVDGCLLKLP